MSSSRENDDTLFTLITVAEARCDEEKKES